jgi:hypothetical protein
MGDEPWHPAITPYPPYKRCMCGIMISALVVGIVIIQSILSYSKIERCMEIFNIFCGTVETHMNGSSHLIHENRLVTSVPRLKASSRHDGPRRFQHFFSHLNRRGCAPLGAAVFIALEHNDPPLIISDYHDFQEKSSKKQTIAPGGSTFSCFRPRRPGIPPSAIISDKVENNTLKKRGGQGGVPLGLLLPLGERGSFSRFRRE